MANMERAIVVGPQKFAQWLSAKYDVEAREKVADVWTGLSSGEIDPNTSLVIIFPGTVGGFDDMTQMVAAFSSGACVNIFIKDSMEESHIRKSVDEKFADHQPAPFFFFTKENSFDTIDNNMATWQNWLATQVSKEDMGASESDNDFILSKNKDSYVYTFTSTKGGSGKTSTTLLVAHQIAMSTRRAGNEKRVCVVDFDVFAAQLGPVIGAINPTVADLMRLDVASDAERFSPQNLEKVKVSRALQRPNGQEDGAVVDYFLAPVFGTQAWALPDSFFYKLVIALTHSYDFVILDTSNEYMNDARVRKVAYTLADAIMFITTLANPSIMGLKKWFKLMCSPPEVGGLGMDRRKIGIIINRGVANTKDYVNSIREAADPDWSAGDPGGQRILGVIPDAPTMLFLQATNSFHLEYLLFDTKFKIGESAYQIARNLVPQHISLSPLVTIGSKQEQRRVIAKQEESPQEPQEEEKPGFFARLFGKK